MSKVTLEGYVIDIGDGNIDFSAVPDFDLSRLDYILDPKTGIYYYARPRSPVDWGTWNGAIYTPSRPQPWAYLDSSSELICLSDPPPVT